MTRLGAPFRPFRRSRPEPEPDPPAVRTTCEDCHAPAHPGVLCRLDGRMVCVRCFRAGVAGRAA